MSMISAQIDELRKAAEYYDGSEVAAIMRHAADTIWQLRDDLQRANAEIARLRSELESVGAAAYLYGRGDLLAENAKLRELCEQCAIELYVNGNVTDASTEMLFDDMRELGIEVGR